MSTNFTARVASFTLAVLMTLGMLGSIQNLAKVEARLGATNALVAEAAHGARA